MEILISQVVGAIVDVIQIAKNYCNNKILLGA